MNDAYEHDEFPAFDDDDADDARQAPAAQERTFEALPPTPGRGFATTWWGHAWLKALEDTALDSQQLKTGRMLARGGSVGAVSVRPGRITAVVQDRDGSRHRSDVLFQQLAPQDWDRFLDMAVERAGHIAALLDREMPPHLVEDAAAAGVELLPGIGDLEPQCTCDAWDHCRHTAALCYQVARLLDQDPFVLLLMRGRAERAVLDDLQVRSAAHRTTDEPGGPPQPATTGIPAAEAYAVAMVLPPLPQPPLPPDEPGPGPSLDTEAEPAPGTDVTALEFLAAQAARSARRLLTEALAPGHAREPVAAEPTAAQDAVRLAAAGPGPAVTARLASGSGRSADAMALAVRAWECGGAAALAVLEEEWAVPPDVLARARAAMDSSWDDDERPAFRVAGHRWTLTGSGAQLRLDRDGRWWPYSKEGGRWTPAGPAALDPASALATMTGGI